MALSCVHIVPGSPGGGAAGGFRSHCPSTHRFAPVPPPEIEPPRLRFIYTYIIIIILAICLPAVNIAKNKL